jgi:hypothetical protein
VGVDFESKRKKCALVPVAIELTVAEPHTKRVFALFEQAWWYFVRPIEDAL